MLKIVVGQKNGGGGGNARGCSAKAIIDYAEDRRAERYYGEGGKADLLAMGNGWVALGLQPGEQPSRKQLEHLLNGYGLGGEEVARIRVVGTPPEIRAGIDLTFSAPKSFSVIAALADRKLKARLREAHAEAVHEAILWIEERGYVTLRSGLNGAVREPAARLAAQVYFHETSRAMDPQEHAHAIIFNIAQMASGEWRRIDPADIFRNKIEIGAIYRAALAKRLVEMGYSIERDRTSFRIAGVPQNLVDKWSKGGDAIKEKLMEWGATGGKAAQAAAYVVRTEKVHACKEELNTRWRGEVVELGISEDEIESIGGGNGDFAPYDEIEVIKELSSKNATFSERDLRKAVAIAMNSGAGGRGEVRASIDAIWNNPALIELVDYDGNTRWTTQEMREIEVELVRNVECRRGKAKPIKEKTIVWAIAEAERIMGFKFSEEQRVAIHHLMGSKNCDKFVEGVAGSGKSTLALAVRLGYEREGRQVFGMALASKAASGLGDGTGIETCTIDSFLYRIKNGRLSPKAGSMVLIDEANMSDTRQIARVVSVAHERGLEIGFIGDRLQLQAIQAGSAFSFLYDRANKGDKAEITKSSRQTGVHGEQWREFVHGIRSGKNKEALRFLDRLGN